MDLMDRVLERNQQPLLAVVIAFVRVAPLAAVLALVRVVLLLAITILPVLFSLVLLLYRFL